jgi:hypothetical protein
MNTRYRGTRRVGEIKRKVEGTALLPDREILPNGAPVQPSEEPMPVESIVIGKVASSDLAGSGGVSTGLSDKAFGLNMTVAARA